MYENFSFQEVIILLHLPYAIKQRFSILCCYIRLLWFANWNILQLFATLWNSQTM